MKTIPAEVWLSWPLPNHVNPETSGPAGMIVNGLFMGIAIPIVCLRLYSRLHTRQKSLGLDDFFCALGLFFAIGLSISFIVAVYVYNCRVHVWDGYLDKWEPNLKIAMAAKVLFGTAGACIRQSLLFFYLRLLGEADLRRLKYAIHAATVANAVSWFVSACLMIFMCQPVWAYWTYPSDAHGTCIDEGITVVTCGTVLAFLDLVILMFPVFIVVRLQMPLRRKLGVCVLLNLGLVSTIAAGLRTYYSWVAFGSTYDLSWYATPVYICGIVEVYLAMICSCAPAVRMLLLEKAAWVMKPFRVVGNLISGLFSRSDRDDTGDSSTKAEEYPSADYPKIVGDHELSTADSTYSKRYALETYETKLQPEPTAPNTLFSQGPPPPEYHGASTTAMGAEYDTPVDVTSEVQIRQPARRGLSSEWATRQQALMVAAKTARTSAETDMSSPDSTDLLADHTPAIQARTNAGARSRAAAMNASWRMKPLPDEPLVYNVEAQSERLKKMQQKDTFLFDDSMAGSGSDAGSIDEEFRSAERRQGHGR